MEYSSMWQTNKLKWLWVTFRVRGSLQISPIVAATATISFKAVSEPKIFLTGSGFLRGRCLNAGLTLPEADFWQVSAFLQVVLWLCGSWVLYCFCRAMVWCEADSFWKGFGCPGSPMSMSSCGSRRCPVVFIFYMDFSLLVFFWGNAIL